MVAEGLHLRLEEGLESLASILFADSNSKIADYVFALIIGCLFPVGRAIFDRWLYDPIGRWSLGIPAYKKSDDAATFESLVRLKKYKESFYKVGVQLTFTVVLALVALRKPWAYDTRLFWSECTGLPCEAPVSLGERFVYALELGFYVQAIPMLFLWETKRKDRWEVLAHHVVTIVLIAYSYWLNLTRVGVMVLVCHEANDIFLEAAKMSRYADNEPASTAWFVAFLVTWVATRVLAFPLIVIHSTLWESQARAAELGGINISPHWGLLNAFLGFLYLLHVYWTYLILRIVIQKLSGGKLDDIREAEEEKAEAEAMRSAAASQSAAAAGASPVRRRRAAAS